MPLKTIEGMIERKTKKLPRSSMQTVDTLSEEGCLKEGRTGMEFRGAYE